MGGVGVGFIIMATINQMQLSLPKGLRYIAVSLATGAFKQEKRPWEDAETADYAAVCF